MSFASNMKLIQLTIKTTLNSFIKSGSVIENDQLATLKYILVSRSTLTTLFQVAIVNSPSLKITQPRTKYHEWWFNTWFCCGITWYILINSYFCHCKSMNKAHLTKVLLSQLYSLFAMVLYGKNNYLLHCEKRKSVRFYPFLLFSKLRT